MANQILLLTANSLWNIANFRLGLIKYLQRSGFEIVVVAPPDISSRVITDAQCRYIPLELDRKGTSIARDARLILQYRSIIKAAQPFAILAFTIKPNIYSALAAMNLRIPVINNVSGLGTTFIRENWISSVARVLYRIALSRSHCVFFQNPDDRALFLSLGLTKDDRSRLLPGSGVDLNHFPLTPLPSVSESTKFTFLLIGRLLWDKGIAEFVKAAESLKRDGVDAQFQLLGPLDPENRTAISKTDLECWIREGTISYLGNVADVRPHIANAHCVVLPSYREGLPRSLLEAAAMGRPIVATNVPGCREVVEDGVNGILCEPRSSESLAASMKTILELDEHSMIGMSVAGRKKVEDSFSEEMVFERYLEVVSNLMNQPPR